MDKMEMLARAWIECDPNRAGAQRFSGFHPDDMNDPPPLPEGLDKQIALTRPSSRGEPHWKWFLPRAEALDAYIKKHGYTIVRIGGEDG